MSKIRILGIDPGLVACSFVTITANLKKSTFKIKGVRRLNFLEIPLCRFISKKGGKKCELHGTFEHNGKFMCSKHRKSSYKKCGDKGIIKVDKTTLENKLIKKLHEKFDDKFYDEIYIEDVSTIPKAKYISESQKIVTNIISSFFKTTLDEKTTIKLVNARSKYAITKFDRSLLGRKNYTKRKRYHRDIYLDLLDKFQPKAKKKFFSTYIKNDDLTDAFAIAYINILPRFSKDSEVRKYMDIGTFEDEEPKVKPLKTISYAEKKIKEALAPDTTDYIAISDNVEVAKSLAEKIGKINNIFEVDPDMIEDELTDDELIELSKRKDVPKYIQQYRVPVYLRKVLVSLVKYNNPLRKLAYYSGRHYRR